MPVRHLPFLLLAATLLVAGEAPSPPDPYGLGERLALIEALKTEFGIATSPGQETEALRARWAAAWKARWASTAEVRYGESARQRLIRQLRERYHLAEVPDLPLAELESLRDDLEQRRQSLDQQGADVSDHPAVGSSRPRVAATAPAAAPLPTSRPVPHWRELELREPGVSFAVLVEDPKPALLVQFGGERAGEFSAIYARMYALLATSPTIPSAVFLLGHGSGTQIGGVAIDDHLRRHKVFYETLGHTRPAAPVACLVIASCAVGSPNQMQEIRDGLGYYPVWRVGTWTRSYANGLSVLGAFEGIHRRPADPPWRGLFLTGRADGSPASLGEVGRDGARGNLVYVDLVRRDGTQVWMER